jgi:beta propeller repeat protein
MGDGGDVDAGENRHQEGFGMRERYSASIWLVAALVWLAWAELGSAAPVSYVHSSVRERVRDHGQVRVIVEMGDPALPQARARDWRLRGPAIAELARRVKAAAPRLQVRREYRIFPFLAGTVDELGLRELMACPTVEAVYPDRRLEAALDESGPLIGQDYAEGAGWDGDGVAIAILDTGIDYTHPALASGKVVAQWDFVNEDDDAMDDEGHGTHVAGIAAGTGATYRGIAPGADLVALKVLDDTGIGYSSVLISAVQWCIEHKDEHNIRVISMSLSDTAEWRDPDECDADPEGQAMASALDNGILTVAAAGNEGYTGGIGIPACASAAMAVGATYDASYGETMSWRICADSTPAADDVACFSNRGELLDVYAPGAMITSALLGGDYVDGAGTSAATPHVAGAAAVIFDRLGPTTAAAETVRARLRRTGVQIVDPDTNVGTPRIDLERALDNTPAAGPDLIVTNVSVSDSFGLVGSAVDVSVTVKNQGDAASGACTAVVVLSENAIGSANDYLVATVAVPALDAGQSYDSGTVGGNIPGAPPGEYRIAGFADSEYEVPEYDETDNGLAGADFQVSALSSYTVSNTIPRAMLKGQTYSVSVELWNDGTASWSTGEGYALGAVSPEGTARWGVSEVGLPGGQTVAPGGTAVFTFEVTAPSEVGLYPCHWRMKRGGVYFGELVTGAEKVRVLDEAQWGQHYPSVSGEWAAYEDYSGWTGSAVSVTNLTSGGTMTLADDIPFVTDEAGWPLEPYEYFDVSYQFFPEISGSWVTWMVDDYPEWEWNWQVTAYDVQAPSVLPLRVTYQGADAIFPAIDGTRVVWEDYRNDPDGGMGDFFLEDDPDIYICDLTDVTGPDDHFPTVYPLCTSDGPQFAPRISGDLVVWEDWRDLAEPQSDIYLYDLSADTDGDGTPNWKDDDRPDPDPAEVQLTHTWWPEEFPDVSGRQAVWLDLRRDPWSALFTDIYMMDVDILTATAVATDPPAPRGNPRVSGTSVTWTDWGQGQPDIYWRNMATGYGGPIAASAASEIYSDISGDRVIYAKHRTTVVYYDDEDNPYSWPVYNVWVQNMPRDGSVGAHTFTDVTSDSWAWEHVEATVANGVVQGYPEGTYQPSLVVTRDQMAVYIGRAIAGGDSFFETYTPAGQTFPDIDPGTWAYKYIEFCADPARDVVKGFEDGTYQPTLAVNRGQMAAYIGRAIAGGDSFFETYTPAGQTFPDIQPGDWAYKYVEYIAEQDVTQGYPDGLYHPEIDCSRDQMAVYVARAFDYVD